MRRSFKKKYLLIFLSYSLALAFAKYLSFRLGSEEISRLLGYLLLLGQVPAMPLVYPFNFFILGKIFGFGITFTYLRYSNYPESGGFFNLVNDLILIVLSLITYTFYFLLLNVITKKTNDKI